MKKNKKGKEKNDVQQQCFFFFFFSIEHVGGHPCSHMSFFNRFKKLCFCTVSDRVLVFIG